MTLSIGQVAEKTGLSPYTLRYYEKEGLLPFVSRNRSGIREFKEEDMEWLSVITCLKNVGMPIRDIRAYIDLCMEGDMTLEKRLEIFRAQQQVIDAKLEELMRYKKKIDYKVWYYETAVEAGTESIHKNGCELPDE